MRRKSIFSALFALVIVIGGILGSETQAEAAGGNYVTVFAENDPGTSSILVLNSAGNPVIAYWDDVTDAMRILRCDDPNCGPGGDTVNSPDSGPFLGVTDIVLDSAQNPVVTYGVSGDLKLLHCNDPACAPGGDTITTPDLDGAQATSLVLDGVGNPVIAYQVPGNTLRVRHCDDPNCAPGGDIVASPDTTGNQVGFGVNIVLDGAGFPVISYQDSTASDLKILHCGNANCSAGNSNVVGDPANVGNYTNLELDSMGRPVVAYRSNSSLRVLHCDDVNCAAGGDSIETPVADIGLRMSMALSSGNPVIAYMTSAPGYDLAVLRCNDANCAAGGDSITRPDTAGLTGDFSTIRLRGANPVISYTFAPLTGIERLKLMNCADSVCTADFDGDGCPDANEQQMHTGSELTGGRRDRKIPNDYFNPTGDGQNRVDDVLAVVDQYFMDDTDGIPGQPPYSPGYDPDTDRTLAGPNPWNTGVPNGLQRVDDILNALKQYFHDCA